MFISVPTQHSTERLMSGLKTQTTDSNESAPQVAVAQLSPDMMNLNILFKVVSIGVTRKVVSRTSGRHLLISEVRVGDHTGTITLVLWNDDVETLEQGRTYLLKGGFVSIYDDCMQLAKGKEAEIIPSDREIEGVELANDMSRPFALRAPKRKRSRSKSGRSMSGEQGREAKGYCTWKGF